MDYFRWITRLDHRYAMMRLNQADEKLRRIDDDLAIECREVLVEAVAMLERYRAECDHHIAKRREQADTIDNKLADLARRLDAQ